MNYGFLKVAVGIPETYVANVTANTESIKNIILKAHQEKIDILVLPELCITAATCGDLFFNSLLISSCKKALFEITDFTKEKSTTVIVGLPLEIENRLYNCAAVICNGKIIEIIPKTNIPSSRYSNQSRYFESKLTPQIIPLENGQKVPVDTKPLTPQTNSAKFSVAVTIGNDFLSPDYRCEKADIILNIASVNQIANRTNQCENAIKNISAKNGCTYVLASSGKGESTTDNIYAGLGFIAQSGKIIEKSTPFSDGTLITTKIDINKNFKIKPAESFPQKAIIEKNPFLPSDVDRNDYLEEILQIQSHALARRISHTYAKTAVIGISGGLDSTLALLVAARAMRILNRSPKDILAITMPCFGTTKRTRSNSEILCSALGVAFREINITESVKQHFKDIGQAMNDYSVTYENAQARERTQVLMDVANKTGGIVIGTGDLSELALGWATYNGDHMSMYGVNSGVPKTLIRHIVQYEANNSKATLKEVLCDILNTPVSPELLPANANGEIAQKTEDLVGPYELHDFFLYYTVANGKSPKEIFKLAKNAFPEYDGKTILYWLHTFIRRFFNQQFKRSCLPDGPKVLPISLSPRGDWQMPSDAYSKIWLDELKEIEI